MKKIFFKLSVIGFVIFSACNANSKKGVPDDNNVSEVKSDSIKSAGTIEDKSIKTITATYPNVDSKVSAFIKEIVDHYLAIKNSLANDNGNEAADGGKGMEEAIHKLDKSLFTPEQKKTYEEIEEEMKEDAEHIGKNGHNIRHQREHFSMMSESVHDLVKAFGAGKILYQDHCPMYNENKGADWLSEEKEIKNPYLGTEMPACGSVEEILK